MDGFIAVILICLNTIPPEACTEETAVDIMSNQVRSELDCLTGWQEDISRSALREEIGRTAYVKTLCRRIARVDDASPKK
jgi:hypothetical protein